MKLLPTSALKVAVKNLPDDFRMNKSSLPNHLLKNVKQDELDHSGFSEAFKSVAEDHKFTKQELVDLETNRKDLFSSEYVEPNYSDHVIEGTDQQQYFEKVRAFKSDEHSTDPVVSHYESEPNYLSHTRGSVGKVGDVSNTRIVQEIQSDLHQRGRIKGYGGRPQSTIGVEDLETGYATRFNDESEAMDYIDGSGNRERFELIYDLPKDEADGIRNAPLKKNWARKSIELEILNAVEEGQQAIAIPLEGVKSELNRSDGVQKWYETKIRSTMKKIAKQIPGAKYKEVVSKVVAHDGPMEVDFALSWLMSKPEVIKRLNENLIKHVPDPDPLLLTPKLHAQTLARGNRSDEASKVLTDDEWLDLIGSKPSDINHGQIVLPEADKSAKGYPEWTKKFELYSAGALAVAASGDSDAMSRHQEEENPIGVMLRAGEKPGDVMDVLQEDQGFDDEQATQAVISALQSNIDDLKGAEGITPEMIKEEVEDKYGSFLDGHDMDYGEPAEELEPGREEQEEFNLIPVADIKEYDEKSTRELAVAADNVLSKHSDLFKFAKGFALEDPKLIREATKAFQEVDYSIANSLRSMGRNVEVTDQGLVEIDAQGHAKPLSEGFWSDAGHALMAGEKELGSALIGAGVANYYALPFIKRSAAYLSKLPWVPGKVIAGAMIVAADTVGGAIGATGGRGLDIAYNSYAVKQDLELEFYKNQMVETGIFGLMMGPISSMGLRGAAGLIRTVGKAGRTIMDGNTKGAYEALQKFTNLDEDQIAEIVTRYEKVSGLKLEGTKETKAFEVVTKTQADSDALAKSAAQYNPSLVVELSREMDSRAKQVIKLTEESSPDNIGIVVKDELEKYTTKVKDYYSKVKLNGIKQVGKENSININKVPIDKFISELNENIHNKALRKIVKLHKEVTTGNSFKSLVELRSSMNGLKYNTALADFVEFKDISKIVTQLDRQIASVATKDMRNGDIWLKEWKTANKAYSNMLVTEKNVLYKALTKKGVTTDNIVKSLSKYVTSIDGTFMKVVGNLPPKIRDQMEGSVLEHVTKKYTAGDVEGLQAIDFPALTEVLSSVSFKSTKARHTKRAVKMLSEVFKNDKKLHRLSDDIHVDKGGSTMTDDLLRKLHWTFVNKVFGRMKSMVPFSENAKYIALGLKIEKAMRNPKDHKAVSALIEEFPKDEEIATGIRQLALVSAEFGENVVQPYVQMHKIGAPAVKNGKYGRGIYWSTDVADIKGRAGPNKLRTSKRDMLPERIATEADIKSVLGVEEITDDLIKNSPSLQQKLQERGYDGFAVKHDVLIFTE